MFCPIFTNKLAWDILENIEGHVLLPRTVLSHTDSKTRSEEQFSGGDEIALLRSFKLQDGGIPDESVEFTEREKKDEAQGQLQTLR